MLSRSIKYRHNYKSISSNFSRFISSSRVTENSQKFPLNPCINEILTNPPSANTKIQVSGWIKASRISKNVAFIDIVDGTTHQDVKCIVRPPSLLPEALNTGSSIEVSGVWSEGKGKQKHEVQVTSENEGKVNVLGEIEELYPLQKKNHSIQFLRTIPQYRWRTESLASILRFRSQVETNLVNFFNKHSFIKTHPPIVTASDCEGAGEMFRIESNSMLNNTKEQEKFFGKEAFLTVSTQLHLETLCAALNRVWTLTPCFRAEESDTNRHLSEFWMLEAEIAFTDSLTEVTKFAELMIKSTVEMLVENKNNEGSNLIDTVDKSIKDQMTSRWEMLLSKENWDSITYTEAIEILQKNVQDGKVKFTYSPVWGDSLKSEHEKWLAGEYFKGPVFVTDYPLEEKAFYMKINEDKKTVACFDLLVPDIGELIGGSLREHDLQKLTDEMIRRSMDPKSLEWYLDLRRNGSMPHGGFGMGFERLLLYLSHGENIKDVIPFPRNVNNCIC